MGRPLCECIQLVGCASANFRTLPIPIKQFVSLMEKARSRPTEQSTDTLPRVAVVQPSSLENAGRAKSGEGRGALGEEVCKAVCKGKEDWARRV